MYILMKFTFLNVLPNGGKLHAVYLYHYSLSLVLYSCLLAQVIKVHEYCLGFALVGDQKSLSECWLAGSVGSFSYAKRLWVVQSCLIFILTKV